SLEWHLRFQRYLCAKNHTPSAVSRQACVSRLRIALLRFRQWEEGARLAGSGNGATRGIRRRSGGVLRRVAAVSLGEEALRGIDQPADFWRAGVKRSRRLRG